MSKRKGWDELSETYRRRLSRNGVTRAGYESGSSIKAARGHANTPERPEDAYTTRGKQRFKRYLERVSGMRKEMIDRKVRLFGGRFKFNDERSRQFIMEGGTDVPAPGPKELRDALDMTDDQIEALLHDPDADKKWRFLWYH